MGSGRSNLYFNTYGAKSIPGSIDFMDNDDLFSKYIAKRKDIDQNGFFDIIAHGTSESIQITHNGKHINVNHRVIAKLLKTNKKYKKQGIRLLSCSTGQIDSGFAQNLANKLKVPVIAPTDILWATPSGKYYVASGTYVNGTFIQFGPKKKKGFKTFYPNKYRRK